MQSADTFDVGPLDAVGSASVSTRTYWACGPCAVTFRAVECWPMTRAWAALVVVRFVVAAVT
jgi:hypothetical protein